MRTTVFSAQTPEAREEVDGTQQVAPLLSANASGIRSGLQRLGAGRGDEGDVDLGYVSGLVDRPMHHAL